MLDKKEDCDRLIDVGNLAVAIDVDDIDDNLGDEEYEEALADIDREDDGLF